MDTLPVCSSLASSEPLHGPPPLFLTLSEPLRSALELGFLATGLLPMLWDPPAGDGHRVIVLPGFLLNDESTWCLRAFLRGLGYQVHGFGLGPNLGARTVGVDGRHLIETIERIAGDEPVSLVGHSLGGVLAREYARRHPARVRRVITLGSPYAGDERSMPRAVVRLRRSLTLEPAVEEVDRSPLPVPHTIIYSESDGVVAPFDCRHPDADADNIEVPGAHIGLVLNSTVFRVVAERLATPRIGELERRRDRRSQSLRTNQA